MASGLFKDQVAWFSTSVPKKTIKVWTQQGGSVSSQDDENVLFLFADDASAADASAILDSPASKSGDLSLFRSQWITDSMSTNSWKNLTTYYLKPIRSPAMKASPTPAATAATAAVPSGSGSSAAANATSATTLAPAASATKSATSKAAKDSQKLGDVLAKARKALAASTSDEEDEAGKVKEKLPAKETKPNAKASKAMEKKSKDEATPKLKLSPPAPADPAPAPASNVGPPKKKSGNPFRKTTEQLAAEAAASSASTSTTKPTKLSAPAPDPAQRSNSNGRSKRRNEQEQQPAEQPAKKAAKRSLEDIPLESTISMKDIDIDFVAARNGDKMVLSNLYEAVARK